jgi:hypothetical protein
MKDNLKKLSFDLPAEVLEVIGSEMRPERAMNDILISYSSTNPDSRHVLSGNELEKGYKQMARINLGMAEMGLRGDVCCLLDYEEILRDDSDDTKY